MTPLRIAGQTDVGRHRQDNQDAFLCQPLWSAERALLVVIDGVGGYAGGAQAAAIAQSAIGQYMQTPTGDTLTMLREAVVYANNQIVREREANPSLARMCCVLTAAVADTAQHRLHYVHVGDTRLYRLRQGRLDKLTHDHSLVGVREDANQLTEHEAMQHPRRNEILRDVGSGMHRVDDPEFLESGETDFRPGDVLLLCSDGLTDMLDRAQVASILAQPVALEAQGTELIRQANEAGGQDNITVVLGQFVADSHSAGAMATDAPPAVDAPPATLLPGALPDGPLRSDATPLPPTAAPRKDVAPAGRPATTLPKAPNRHRWAGWLAGGVMVAGLGWWLLARPQPAAHPNVVAPTDTSAASTSAVSTGAVSTGATPLRLVPADSAKRTDSTLTR